MSIYPNQNRYIDPHSSHNSNIISELTKMITDSRNCISSSNPIYVSIITTSTINVSSGYLFKDDILLEITSDFTIDITDSDFYIYDSTSEIGYHWLVASYDYNNVYRSDLRQLSIRIFRPSEISNFDEDSYIFLKALYINGSQQIISVKNIDPDNPLLGYRKYSLSYDREIEYIDTTSDLEISIDSTTLLEINFDGEAEIIKIEIENSNSQNNWLISLYLPITSGVTSLNSQDLISTETYHNLINLRIGYYYITENLFLLITNNSTNNENFIARIYYRSRNQISTNWSY